MFFTVPGYFTHINMDESQTTVAQHVNYPTRQEENLDLLYANIRDTYRLFSTAHFEKIRP